NMVNKNSSTYRTAVQGEISRLNEFNYKDLNIIRKKYEECLEDSRILQKYLLKDLEQPDIKYLNKTIIAVDGSNYVEEYNSIVISLALAYVYTTKGYTERYLPEISIVPPYYSSLVNSIIMKTLEFQIVIDLLNDDELNNKDIDLILFDGPLSFPDEAIKDSVAVGKEIVIKFFNDYVSTANKLFNIIKEQKIPTIGLVKDSMSNKYFLSLSKHFNSNFVKLGDLHLKKKMNINRNKLHEYVKKWDKKGDFSMISESVMIKYLFEPDKIFNRTITLPIGKGLGLKSEIPIDNLKYGNLLGFYINILPNYKAFFIEIPSYFRKNLEEILKIFNAICYYSLKPGYPMPLYAAHKKVELNKKRSKNKLNVIKQFVRIKDPKLYNIVFESRFHPEIE
ncbi:MAG: hypothetical protein GF311_12190, partial [Candidatus Lokiarchaeota archaeon]|nr:hypothetical protein [Candidatus Lokiarchaeota archaeon]